MKINNLLQLTILPYLTNNTRLQMLNILFLFRRQEHIINCNCVKLIILMFLLDVVREQSFRSYSLTHHTIEVQFILREELHALDFAYHDIVVPSCVGIRLHVDIVHVGVILTLLVNKDRQPKLQYPKITGSLFNPFIELHMIRKEPLDLLQLTHQPSELTVKGNKIRRSDMHEHLWQYGLEVYGVYLHFVIIDMIYMYIQYCIVFY